MKQRHRISTMMMVWVLTVFSQTGWAGADLLADQSAIQFVSIKNATVAEVHHLPNLRGSIDDKGLVTVQIVLADVETHIPIRNERMQAMFFEVASYPLASLRASVDFASLAAMNNGAYRELELSFQLDLHGREQRLSTRVGVARLGRQLHVNTLAPLLLNTGSFNLTDGVERLREVVGLKSIATAVPVTARLVFELE